MLQTESLAKVIKQGERARRGNESLCHLVPVASFDALPKKPIARCNVKFSTASPPAIRQSGLSGDILGRGIPRGERSNPVSIITQIATQRPGIPVHVECYGDQLRPLLCSMYRNKNSKRVAALAGLKSSNENPGRLNYCGRFEGCVGVCYEIRKAFQQILCADRHLSHLAEIMAVSNAFIHICAILLFSCYD
jgi:hypothetical protein